MVRGPRPWLWLPPHWSYQLAHRFLPLIAKLSLERESSWQSVDWRGLHFRSPLGLAGGVDKDAAQVLDWWKLGAGFLELGTVTPKGQPGHSGKVIDRVEKQQAVWNRLGFPGHGAEAFRERLERLPAKRKTPLFINIGKNATTPLEEAHHDYLFCIEKLHDLADAFVVNVSSPNTAGLRELLRPEKFKQFIAPLREATDRFKTPLLVKLSPDLGHSELKALLHSGIELGLDGWVLTNTSLGLRDGLPFPEEGGVSGRPLAALSKQVLKWAVDELGPPRPDRPLLVSVGGVLTADDISERLRLGADLVQVYSALIFEGPYYFRRMAKTFSSNSSESRRPSGQGNLQ